MKQNQLFRVLLSICLGLIIAGCGPVTIIEYIVPDNYEGFLVIRYQCPDGYTPAQNNNQVSIQFNNNGVACVTQAYENLIPSGISHIARVQTTSGQKVDYIIPGNPSNSKQGLVDGGVTTVTFGSKGDEPPSFIYTVLWLGKVSLLDSLAIDGTFAEKEAVFLEKSIGLPQDRSKWPLAPNSNKDCHHNNCH